MQDPIRATKIYGGVNGDISIVIRTELRARAWQDQYSDVANRSVTISIRHTRYFQRADPQRLLEVALQCAHL